MSPVKRAGAELRANGTGVCWGPDKTERAAEASGLGGQLDIGERLGRRQGLDFLVRAGGSVERF